MTTIFSSKVWTPPWQQCCSGELHDCQTSYPCDGSDLVRVARLRRAGAAALAFVGGGRAELRRRPGVRRSEFWRQFRRSGLGRPGFGRRSSAACRAARRRSPPGLATATAKFERRQPVPTRGCSTARAPAGGRAGATATERFGSATTEQSDSTMGDPAKRA